MIIFIFYFTAATSGPRAAGLWQDDAVYLATAKSIAQGSGYRHIEIPGEPLQTKYPILYPAVLAGGFVIWPDYPQNLQLLLVPGALAAAGFIVLAAIYLRKVFGLSRVWMIAIGVLAALSPPIVSLVRFAMSDLPFALLAVAALFCLDHKYQSAEKASRRRVWLVVSGLLIAAAMLTRSFGITLAVAAPLMLLWKRKFTDAGILLAVIIAAMLPWWTWQSWAATVNGTMQISPIESYELNYRLWLPRGTGEFFRVIWQNSFTSAFGLGHFQLALPRLWMQEIFQNKWSATAILFHVVCYLTAGLTSVGYFVSLRRGARTLHLYAFFYTAVMLAWPFEPYRFLICWTPMILYFLLTGIGWLSGLVHGRIALLKKRPWLAHIPAVAVLATIAFLFVADDLRIFDSTRSRYYIGRNWMNLSDREQLKDWLARNTQHGDVIATNDSFDLFLSVGRQVLDTSSGLDPFFVFYGPDRQWREMYSRNSPSETQWLIDNLNPNLEELFLNRGVTYYVNHADRTSMPMVRFIDKHPDWFDRNHLGQFKPALNTDGGQYQVFRVHASKAEGNNPDL